jgi:hypothetical protein
VTAGPGAEDEAARTIEVEPGRASSLTRLTAVAAQWLDRRYGWDKLSLPLGVMTLAGLRDRLRAQNLFDTGVPTEGGTPTEEETSYRTDDGTWNDLDHPSMGAVGTPFGRNVEPERNRPEHEPMLSTPDPRLVSRVLLTREDFIPATALNVLAAAWIQFEIHDWFSHENKAPDPPENLYRLPAGDGDPAPGDLVIERTADVGVPGKFASQDTHWWDASQVYGSTRKNAESLRDGAYLKVDDGTVPLQVTDSLELEGRHAGFWTGWALMQSLFAREHNAICDHLRKSEKRKWDDDELFGVARLVNSALMAKIHTTEWTPAILAHPTTEVGARINWWGISERLKRSWGRVSDNEVISGIVGSPTDQHGSPYCLTEEFVAIYRMHPLIPDTFSFYSPDGHDHRSDVALGDLRKNNAIPQLRELGMPTVLYSFGVAHPGAITLHNFPRALQTFDRGDRTFDLAAVDIFRNRERGVPRYNRFRQALHKAPVRSFEELTSNRAWAEEIRQVYGGDLDAVDLMIGLYAEDLPRGFGFSDTAFRVFLLMASRRLKSDRFFTRHYDADHYTSAGLEWIDDNSMKSLLIRHCPELELSLGKVDNAFKPWPRAAG